MQLDSDGHLSFFDAPNFIHQDRVDLFGGIGLLPFTNDVAIDSTGEYAYITRPGDCQGMGTGPHPGGIKIVDIASRALVDADDAPNTESACSPPGINELSTGPYFYPVSLKVLHFDKTPSEYLAGEPFPGDYLFASGTKEAYWQPPCIPGQICPPMQFLERQMSVLVFDLNRQWVVTPGAEPELGENPGYWGVVASLSDGPDGEGIFSDHPLDFVLSGDGATAKIYILNAFEEKAYVMEWEWPNLTYVFDNGDPVTIATGANPTDVKVQEDVETSPGIFQMLAYITNAGNDTVTVVDTAMNEELPPPDSPIFQDNCYLAEHYPTSMDTRSDGSRGYSANFHSDTSSVIYLPGNVCQNVLPDGAIHVGQAPIRIVVQPVVSQEDLSKTIKSSLAFAEGEDFTTPSKQPVLVRDWEDVHALQETGANPQAVVSNIDNFQKNVNKWVAEDSLRTTLNESIDLYRASYIHDHPLPNRK